MSDVISLLGSSSEDDEREDKSPKDLVVRQTLDGSIAELRAAMNGNSIRSSYGEHKLELRRLSSVTHQSKSSSAKARLHRTPVPTMIPGTTSAQAAELHGISMSSLSTPTALTSAQQQLSQAMAVLDSLSDEEGSSLLQQTSWQTPGSATRLHIGDACLMVGKDRHVEELFFEKKEPLNNDCGAGLRAPISSHPKSAVQSKSASNLTSSAKIAQADINLGPENAAGGSPITNSRTISWNFQPSTSSAAKKHNAPFPKNAGSGEIHAHFTDATSRERRRIARIMSPGMSAAEPFTTTRVPRNQAQSIPQLKIDMGPKSTDVMFRKIASHQRTELDSSLPGRQSVETIQAKSTVASGQTGSNGAKARQMERVQIQQGEVHEETNCHSPSESIPKENNSSPLTRLEAAQESGQILVSSNSPSNRQVCGVNVPVKPQLAEHELSTPSLSSYGTPMTTITVERTMINQNGSDITRVAPERLLGTRNFDLEGEASSVTRTRSDDNLQTPSLIVTRQQSIKVNQRCDDGELAELLVKQGDIILELQNELKSSRELILKLHEGYTAKTLALEQRLNDLETQIRTSANTNSLMSIASNGLDTRLSRRRRRSRAEEEPVALPSPLSRSRMNGKSQDNGDEKDNNEALEELKEKRTRQPIIDAQSEGRDKSLPGLGDAQRSSNATPTSPVVIAKSARDEFVPQPVSSRLRGARRADQESSRFSSPKSSTTNAATAGKQIVAEGKPGRKRQRRDRQSTSTQLHTETGYESPLKQRHLNPTSATADKKTESTRSRAANGRKAVLGYMNDLESRCRGERQQRKGPEAVMPNSIHVALWSRISDASSLATERQRVWEIFHYQIAVENANLDRSLLERINSVLQTPKAESQMSEADMVFCQQMLEYYEANLPRTSTLTPWDEIQMHVQELASRRLHGSNTSLVTVLSLKRYLFCLLAASTSPGSNEPKSEALNGAFSHRRILAFCPLVAKLWSTCAHGCLTFYHSPTEQDSSSLTEGPSSAIITYALLQCLLLTAEITCSLARFFEDQNFFCGEVYASLCGISCVDTRISLLKAMPHGDLRTNLAYRALHSSPKTLRKGGRSSKVPQGRCVSNPLASHSLELQMLSQGARNATASGREADRNPSRSTRARSPTSALERLTQELAHMSTDYGT